MRPPSAAQSRAGAGAPTPRGFPVVACPDSIARDTRCLLLTHTSIEEAEGPRHDKADGQQHDHTHDRLLMSPESMRLKLTITRPPKQFSKINVRASNFSRIILRSGVVPLAVELG